MIADVTITFSSWEIKTISTQYEKWDIDALKEEILRSLIKEKEPILAFEDTAVFTKNIDVITVIEDKDFKSYYKNIVEQFWFKWEDIPYWEKELYKFYKNLWWDLFEKILFWYTNWVDYKKKTCFNYSIEIIDLISCLKTKTILLHNDLQNEI